MGRGWQWGGGPTEMRNERGKRLPVDQPTFSAEGWGGGVGGFDVLPGWRREIDHGGRGWLGRWGAGGVRMTRAQLQQHFHVFCRPAPLTLQVLTLALGVSG